MRRIAIAAGVLAAAAVAVAGTVYVNNGVGATQVGGKDYHGLAHTLNTTALGTTMMVPAPVGLAPSYPNTGVGATMVGGKDSTGQPHTLNTDQYGNLLISCGDGGCNFGPAPSDGGGGGGGGDGGSSLVVLSDESWFMGGTLANVWYGGGGNALPTVWDAGYSTLFIPSGSSDTFVVATTMYLQPSGGACPLGDAGVLITAEDGTQFCTAFFDFCNGGYVSGQPIYAFFDGGCVFTGPDQVQLVYGYQLDGGAAGSTEFSDLVLEGTILSGGGGGGRGPAGPTGPPGVDGGVGPAGPTGPAGATGPQGTSSCFVDAYGVLYCTPPAPYALDAGSVVRWVQQPDAGGSDTNDCSIGTPCATCQHVLDTYAPFAQGWDTVQLGPGTYPGGCVIEGWMLRQSQDGGQGPGIAIYGSTVAAVLDAGSTTGTVLTAYPANDGGTCPSCGGVVNVSGSPGWATNNLAGLMLEFTSGQAAGVEVPVRFNTASQIVINGDFHGPIQAGGDVLLPQFGDTFAIVAPATTLQGGLQIPGGADTLNGGASTTILIDNTTSSEYGLRYGNVGAQIDIANLNFTGNGGPQIRVAGPAVANVRNNWNTETAQQLAVAVEGASLRLNGNIFKGALFGTSAGTTAGPCFGCSVYAVNNYGLAFTGPGQTACAIIGGGSVEMSGNYFNQEAIDGIEVYEGTSLTSAGDWFLLTGAAILVEPSFQGSSLGSPVSQGVTIQGDVFTGNAQAVNCEGANAIVSIDGTAAGTSRPSAPIITSSNTTALSLQGGCKVAVWPMTDGGLPWSNPVPNTTDITVDGVGYSWAQFTAAQSISDPPNGDTEIWVTTYVGAGAASGIIQGFENFVEPVGLPVYGYGQLPSPCGTPGGAAYCSDAGSDAGEGAPVWCGDDGTTWIFGGTGGGGGPGPTGPTGSAGATGATGATGPAGSSAVADGGVTASADVILNVGALGNVSSVYRLIYGDAGLCAAGWPTPDCVCGSTSPNGFGTCPDAGTAGVLANNPDDSCYCTVVSVTNDAGTTYNSDIGCWATGSDADAGIVGDALGITLFNLDATVLASGNTNVRVSAKCIAGIGVIAGPAGAAGATGAAGSAGATGPTGSAGATGPAGPTGPAGANGANGANGSTGPTGPTGPAGSLSGLTTSGIVYATSATTVTSNSAAETDGTGNVTLTGNQTANSFTATASAGNRGFGCQNAGCQWWLDGSGNVYFVEGTGASLGAMFGWASNYWSFDITGTGEILRLTPSFVLADKQIDANAGIQVGSGAGDNPIEHTHFLAGYLETGAVGANNNGSVTFTSATAACTSSCSSTCLCTSTACCGAPAGITISKLATSVLNAVSGITVNDTCESGLANVLTAGLTGRCLPTTTANQFSLRFTNPTGSPISTTSGIFTVELHTH